LGIFFHILNKRRAKLDMYVSLKYSRLTKVNRGWNQIIVESSVRNVTKY